MSSVYWERIEELFEAAMAVDPDQRDDLLQRRCPDDDGLRAEVAALLTHDDRAPERFLYPLMDPSIDWSGHRRADLRLSAE